MNYHEPALLKESIELLDIQPEGVYVDVTFGGGGHSKAILEKLGDKGRLIAFDQDEAALANVPQDDRLLFVPQNFREIKRFLRYHGFKKVNGILADLGVSSHQLDEGSRGFSYRFEAPLDMRMSQDMATTAADLINDLSVEEMQLVFGENGEVRNARTLAQQLVAARSQKTIRTIGEFLQVVEPNIIGDRFRYLSQVFQALRIEVNQEMDALKEMLEASKELLAPNGRIVVIAYHSLEDRLVKNFFKTGDCSGVQQKDFYGNIARPFQILTKKPVEPSAEEIKRNPRSRSAKLRAAVIAG
jgi:16S rRNA (cytosine1402-N4)-methyltransferase